MASTVHVQGISIQTSEKEVRDFFSFCGKIESLSVKPAVGDSVSTQSATVTFEKETAAKTALLLDNTQLGPSQVRVTAAQSLEDLSGGKSGQYEEEIPQEEKPRARVVAEMLAHGYVLSDQAIQRALQLDQHHGISTRFTKALSDFDAKYKVTERAQQADKSYGVSARADAGWRGLNSYFEKALGTPTGQRVRTFYEQGQKQVLDVHNEARHLAGLKQQGKAGTPETVPGTSRTKCNCQAATNICPCAPGHCACANCGKNPDAKTTNLSVEEAGLEKVQINGEERTKCDCGSDESKCPCEPGKCACVSCPKAS